MSLPLSSLERESDIDIFTCGRSVSSAFEERIYQCKEMYFTSFFGGMKRHILPLHILTRIKQHAEKKASSLLQQETIPLTARHGLLSAQDCETFVKADCTQGKRKGKKKFKNFSISSLVKNDSQNEAKVEEKRKIPNYFIAVQVTNPQICKTAEIIQKSIQDSTDVNLEDALISVKQFHITLMVAQLKSDEEVKQAGECLDRCIPNILEWSCGQLITLEFEGLSAFSGGRVLYAQVKKSPELDLLHRIADEVVHQMGECGITSTDRPGKKFQPHLTLMKFRGGSKLRKQGIRRIESSQYASHVNEVLGSQTIYSLQLCHMHEKREDGYYNVQHEAFIK